MNLILNNIAQQSIEFNFEPNNNQLIQLPAGSTAFLTASVESSNHPSATRIEFREGSGNAVSTFFVNVEWTENTRNQTLNLGNGQGDITSSGTVPHNGTSESSGGMSTMGEHFVKPVGKLYMCVN